MLADIYQLWHSAWPAGLVMLGLGAVFAVVLLAASERLKVDPRVAQIRDVLPKLDCAGCGFANCDEYAEAVVKDGSLLGRCVPGGYEIARQVASLLSLQVSDSPAPRRPVVRCNACVWDKSYCGKYRGIKGCTSASTLANVQKCGYGCLGFGDCVNACKSGAMGSRSVPLQVGNFDLGRSEVLYDAIAVRVGLAAVNYDRCIGCGRCAKACPRGIIQMVPFTHDPMMVVACGNKETGRVTRQMCDVGCIACGLCAKQSDAFSVQDNLARVDYARYGPGEKAEAAMKRCPTKVIVLRGKNIHLTSGVRGQNR